MVALVFSEKIEQGRLKSIAFILEDSTGIPKTHQVKDFSSSMI